MKYKKCFCQSQTHLSGPTAEKIKDMICDQEAKEMLRQHQQGRGKPIISEEFQGHRFTAVGNQLHCSETQKTFIDFLGHYVRTVLGAKWGNAEIAKPLEERHTILQWYDAICSLHREVIGDRQGTICSVKENGLISAYYGLAYNLYLLQHNVELQELLVRRLKQEDKFYAAYYETCVAAWFILAGFTLSLEDEEDSSRTHPEFIASRDGQSFSVEAKAREPGKEGLDVGNQLYKALRKEVHHPRVIFIDMNVGPNIDLDDFAKSASDAVKSREAKMTNNGVPSPPAFVFITNQPCHLALDRTNLPRVCLTVGFKIDDFGHRAIFKSYTSAYKAQKKYELLYDVAIAMVYHTIPSTFNGEVSEFAFGQAERRFQIGSRVEIEAGRLGIIQSGIVNIHDRRAHIIAKVDDGSSYVMQAELTDHEIAAYKAHPETFFGKMQQVQKTPRHPLELFKFFVESYKVAPRDRLLELMANAPNINQLKSFSDEELLYYYAEGLTHSVMEKRGRTSKGSDTRK